MSIILPPLCAANFDIIWFGVVMTIVMEMGLIHPQVGLNIVVIRNVAPEQHGLLCFARNDAVKSSPASSRSTQPPRG